MDLREKKYFYILVFMERLETRFVYAGNEVLPID
jgi:hypothetical protein